MPPTNTFTDNLVRMFQRRNMFGIPEQEPGVNIPPQGVGFQPNTQAQDQFRQGIEQMPQRNKPGMGRRIAGILAGIAGGGPAATESIMYSPYYREMGEWKAKMDPLGDLAKMENQTNTQERLYNQSGLNYQLGSERIRQGDERIAQGTQRLEIDRKKLELNQLKYDNPDHDLQKMVGPDGQMQWFMVNPKKPGSPPIPTGLKTGDLTDAEAIDKSGQWRLRAAQAQGGITRETQAQGDWQRVTGVDGKLYRVNPTTNKLEPIESGDVTFPVPGAGGSSSEQSESQKAAGRKNRIAKLRNMSEEYKNLVDEEGNIANPIAPGLLRSGNNLTTERRAKIYDFIENGIEPPEGWGVPNVTNRPPATSNKTPSPARAMEVAPDNMIKVRNKKTGQTGQMKRSELGQYKDFEEIK